MTKEVVAKTSQAEGIVLLEECAWDDGNVTYDVSLIRTSSYATNKHFPNIQCIEDACRIYNEFSEELMYLSSQKYQAIHKKGKVVIHVEGKENQKNVHNI